MKSLSLMKCAYGTIRNASLHILRSKMLHRGEASASRERKRVLHLNPLPLHRFYAIIHIGGDEMNPLSLVTMVLFTLISFLIIRSLAPYEKTSKLKYISLNNKLLVKCLIPKQKGYVKVNDRRKISVFSFVFYLLFAILVFTLVLMFVLPDIPCEEFVAHFGKRGRIRWGVDTLNEN